MNGIFSTPRVILLAGLITLVTAAHGQGMAGSGMNAPINQIEAIEGHLHQSRTQSSREVDEIAKKKPKTYEFARPASNSQALKQKKSEGESEMPKTAAKTGTKNE